MEFNRLISLVLGFVVLILVFVWISNRFRASTRTVNGRTPTITPTYTPTPTKANNTASRWNPFSFLMGSSTTTPAPTRKTSPSPTAVKVVVQTTGTADQRSNNPSPTKVPTSKPTQKVTQAKVQVKVTQSAQKPTYTNNRTGKTIAQIPETGAPTEVLSILLTALSGGIYLRRKV